MSNKGTHVHQFYAASHSHAGISVTVQDALTGSGMTCVLASEYLTQDPE